MKELKIIYWIDNALMLLQDGVKALKFVRHIKNHLEDGQEVICKICGKNVEEAAQDYDNQD